MEVWSSGNRESMENMLSRSVGTLSDANMQYSTVRFFSSSERGVSVVKSSIKIAWNEFYMSFSLFSRWIWLGAWFWPKLSHAWLRDAGWRKWPSAALSDFHSGKYPLDSCPILPHQSRSFAMFLGVPRDLYRRRLYPHAPFANIAGCGMRLAHCRHSATFCNARQGRRGTFVNWQNKHERFCYLRRNGGSGAPYPAGACGVGISNELW